MTRFRVMLLVEMVKALIPGYSIAQDSTPMVAPIKFARRVSVPSFPPIYACLDAVQLGFLNDLLSIPCRLSICFCKDSHTSCAAEDEQKGQNQNSLLWGWSGWFEIQADDVTPTGFFLSISDPGLDL